LEEINVLFLTLQEFKTLGGFFLIPYTQFTQNGGTYKPMKEEKDAFAAIYTGLTATQRTAATLTGTFRDIALGPQQDWQFPTAKVGIKCSTLDATQKAWVLAAIRTYVADVDTASARTIMTKYTNEINDTYFGFVGSGNMVIHKVITLNNLRAIKGTGTTPSVFYSAHCSLNSVGDKPVCFLNSRAK
jgi:Protein of unknown function (DUF3500)